MLVYTAGLRFVGTVTGCFQRIFPNQIRGKAMAVQWRRSDRHYLVSCPSRFSTRIHILWSISARVRVLVYGVMERNWPLVYVEVCAGAKGPHAGADGGL